MNKNSFIHRQHLGSRITIVILVVLTISVIVLFLPRNSGPQFRYDVGKPWMYGSLIAKFDFPIYKTDAAIKAEKDSVSQNFEPYYNYDVTVAKDNVARFKADYAQGISGLPKEYVGFVADRMAALYKAGIMSTPEYSAMSKDTTKMIRLVTDKKALNVAVRSLLSTMSAYELLFADQRLSAQRQLLQKCNLNEYLRPNLKYDEERSITELNDLLSGIPLASGMVLSGQKIIDRGEIVDDYTYRVLTSFEKETRRRSASSSAIPSTIFGQVIFIGMLVLLFTMYLGLFRKDYFDKPRSIMMIYALITIFPVVVSLMVEHNILNVYVIPFAIAPIFVRVFMDSRTAFISHVTMTLICAAAVKYQYEFIIVQLVAGLVAIYSLRELSQRAQLFRTAVLVTVASCAVYLALQLMQDNIVADLESTMYKYFMVNGVLLLFAYPLM
ncbi:MAG: hydrolase, partial [Prevotella sp.]